ncbi:hypothetical protein CBQ28_07390 [Pseudoalteromonas sp. GCY]|nr:hypothetical protein CBQ28_07390 [Pseudoalteromonas sp. GCY]
MKPLHFNSLHISRSAYITLKTLLSKIHNPADNIYNNLFLLHFYCGSFIAVSFYILYEGNEQ